jgi:hypothetical protein
VLALVLVVLELAPVVEPVELPVVVLDPVFELVVAEPVLAVEPVTEEEPVIDDCAAVLTVLGELSVNCPE